MTQASEEFPGCVEVPISAELILPGVRTAIAQIEGVAISMVGYPIVERVAVHGLHDENGDRQVFTTEVSDSFGRAIAAAMFKRAAEPWVRQEFAQAFYEMGYDAKEAAKAVQAEFRAGA